MYDMLKFSISSAITFLVFNCVNPLHAQTNGVTFLDYSNEAHGISTQGTAYSSCWGWVSPTGREYGLLGTAGGTAIIDLDAIPIQEIQFIPGNPAPYAYREIKTYKHYAYVVSEGGLGVQIIDLSGLPDSVKLVKNFNYVSMVQPDSGKHIDRSHTVTLADGYLYCNGSAFWSSGGCVIFSLRNDPENPEFVGTFEVQYVHDSYVRNDTLYASAIYAGGGLYVVDVKDKAQPVVLGKIGYSGSGTHNAWATIDGKYAITCDEIGSTSHDMKIWALDSLPKSVKVAEWVAEPTSNIHNVHGRGNFAYLAHYTAGMRVVDVHDPRNPVEVGWYDTYPGPSGGYAGCWGVYPYFPSGRWIGSDMQTGLYLCSFTGLLPRIRSPLMAPSDNSTFSTSPTFEWRWAANPAEDPHHYGLHIWGNGLDTTFRVADTSFVPPLADLLPVTGAYSWNVLIQDEYTEVCSAGTFHFTYTGTVDVHDDQNYPAVFDLKQNYPNPFNPVTKIEFNLPASSVVTLKISNTLGQVVGILIDNAMLPIGNHEVVFDASGLPSGMYFYQLTTPTSTSVKKMMLLK